MRRALPFLLVALALRPALAQCPDGTPPPCHGQAASVAVLFMEPRSRNAADSLLAEGLTLEIINTLSGVARLDVKSRFFSRRIAAAADPMRAAQALGVDYLVDGVLELDSARVLMRGALTRTSTGRVVRALGLERRRSDIQGLQATVAQEVAAAVVGRLLPSERARFTVKRVDPRVTELLLTARALRHQYTAASVGQALALAREAVAVDSAYAPAWTEIGTCLFPLLADFEPDSVGALASQAMVANERALALNPSNGVAMSGIAYVRAWAYNDLSPRTESLARRAAALEPGLEAGIALAAVLVERGKVEEGLGVVREAVRHDSLSPIAWATLSFRLQQTRHFVESARAMERALALRPSAQDSLALSYMRRWALLEAGDCLGALAEGRAAPEYQLVIESLRCLGRVAEADSVVRSLLARRTVHPVVRSLYLAWSGQPDSAFAVLDRAFPRRLGLYLQFPAFDPYRQHPAYLALRRRMGLEN